MTNIKFALKAIESEIELTQKRIQILNQVMENLNSLDTIEPIQLNNNSNILIETSNNTKMSNRINPEEFKDYPFNKRFFEKLDYLDKKFPKAWKMKNRIELMIQIEGEECRAKIYDNISQKLKELVKMGFYIGAKYHNDNKCYFYCRPEWINDEGVKCIKPEYKPDNTDFGLMPESKRRDELITWVIGEDLIKK